MTLRKVRVPKFLHELHGAEARISTILLSYGAGLAVAAVALFQLQGTDIGSLQKVLAALVLLDVAAGVVANLSSSTNQHYQQNESSRKGFLLLHVLHSAALAWAFPQHWLYFLFAYLYTLAASLIVNQAQDSEWQQNLAAFFVVIGIGASTLFELNPALLYGFLPLFAVKLILGFSVRRPSFEAEASRQI